MFLGRPGSFLPSPFRDLDSVTRLSCSRVRAEWSRISHSECNERFDPLKLTSAHFWPLVYRSKRCGHVFLSFSFSADTANMCAQFFNVFALSRSIIMRAAFDFIHEISECGHPRQFVIFGQFGNLFGRGSLVCFFFLAQIHLLAKKGRERSERPNR